MAKKALVQKQQGTPKFKVRGLHAVPPVRPLARGVPRFGLCRICFREMAHAGRSPA